MKRLVRALMPRALWSKLRALSLKWRLVTYKRRRVHHRYGGFPLDIEIVDQLGEAWYDTDWAELPEIQMLKGHALRNGARVLELGAHQGVVALMLSRCVGPEGAVVAVEAHPHNATAARKNVELNAASNCTIVQAAVAARSGTLIVGNVLNGRVDEADVEFGQFEVEALSIDDLSAQHGTPDVLFIDIEGFECRALEGGQKTLSSRPNVFIEVHCGVGLEHFGGSTERIMSFFPEAEYQRYYADKEGTPFRPIGETNALPEHRFFFVAIPRK